MKNCVLFDWFSFTIKNRSLRLIMSDLGLIESEFSLNKTARFGYRKMISHDAYHIEICFDGTEDMGIHIHVGGSAIKYFMDCFLKGQGTPTPFGGFAVTSTRCYFTAFAEYVKKYGSFSRVDVCIDTDHSFMSPENIHDLVQNGDLVSLYRSYRFVSCSDGSATLYIGSRNSNSFIRIYDKAKEQKDFDSVLYRFEIEFKDSHANNFMFNFIESGLSSSFAAFIESHLRFVKDGSYYGKVFDEWKNFIDLIKNGKNVSYVNYTLKRRKNDIESLLHMFTQYNNKINSFLTNHGTIDDFFEFLEAVDRSLNTSDFDIYIYLQSRGWSREIVDDIEKSSLF